jgi:2-dehydro-3-deoxy-D-arabinonate dehydratase
MKYYRVQRECQPRLVADDGENAYDLTSAHDGLDSFSALARAADRGNRGLDELASEYTAEADVVEVDGSELGLPVEPPEVWAAGVTYKISEEAREEESDDPDVYMNVYQSERPEVFFKATRSRTVGPGDDVGIRGDSDWDVPEPELGVVLHREEVVGFTIGNDVSSRSIEGENPLYLPQAKTYDRCCSLGPCVASTGSIEDPHDLEMTMTIERDGEILYEESTNTGEMVKTCEQLASYYTRHNAIPETAVLLTGTALVPSSDFTLRPGDDIAIQIEDIGTLENGVTTV